jgi:hypothetical protein
LGFPDLPEQSACHPHVPRELDRGARLVTNLRDADHTTLHLDAPVGISFDVLDGVTLPQAGLVDVVVVGQLPLGLVELLHHHPAWSMTSGSRESPRTLL